MASHFVCRNLPPSTPVVHSAYGGHSARRMPRGSLVARATTLQQTQSGHSSGERVKERVLRYPGGQERRIRYPVSAHTEEEETISPIESFEDVSDWWGVDRYYFELPSDEEDESFRKDCSGAATTSGRAQLQAGRADVINPTHQELPSTPGNLLQYVNSEEYKAARIEKLRLVRSSYKLLEGSPWLQTKPVYVLATHQRDTGAALTFTFRTRVQQKDTEDQLTKVLGKRRADGSSLIRCEELRDGIITFEDESDAHRFSSLLEADGTEAMVAQCDAHELFRECQSVRGVVVLIKECTGLSCHLPLPEELATALRGQRSLEDPADL